MVERHENFDFEFAQDHRALLGHGAFAMVYKGKLISNPATAVAVKVINKEKISRSQNMLREEVNTLKLLRSEKHENIVALLQCFATRSHVYIVTEYCNYGDLSAYMQAKETLPEGDIQHFVVQIARAIKLLNEKNIVHRDLKPQNILLNNPTARMSPPARDLVVKLADFGFARTLTNGGMAGTLCGSPMYMAPEVITSMNYCAKADLWSIGTIIYQALTGVAPFQAKTPQLLRSFYLKTVDPRPSIPPACSGKLRDLLLALLKKDVEQRISFDAFFTHPFLTSKIEESRSENILKSADKPRISCDRTRDSGGKRQSNDSTDFELIPSSTPSEARRSTPATSSTEIRAYPMPNHRAAYLAMEKKREGGSVASAASSPPQETILEAELSMLSKLRFVLELVETLMNVAENKSNPIAIMMEEGRRRGTQKREPNSDAYRRAEQLVLYIKALEMLSSALGSAQKQIISGSLHPSLDVKHVLSQLNDKYHKCLARSQKLASSILPSPEIMALISAERIMYKHAIELCQVAVRDELTRVGEPEIWVTKYQAARLLLEALSAKIENGYDRAVLTKHLNVIEKRIEILEKRK